MQLLELVSGWGGLFSPTHNVGEKTVPEPVCLNNEHDLINLKKTLLSLQSTRLGPRGNTTQYFSNDLLKTL